MNANTKNLIKNLITAAVDAALGDDGVRGKHVLDDKGERVATPKHFTQAQASRLVDRIVAVLKPHVHEDEPRLAAPPPADPPKAPESPK